MQDIKTKIYCWLFSSIFKVSIICFVDKVAHWIGRADPISCIGSSCCIYWKTFYTTSKHPVSFRRGEFLFFRSGNMLQYVIYSDRLENILCLCLPKVNFLEEASPHLSLKCPYLWKFLWCLIQCYHFNYSVFHVSMRLGVRLVVGHTVVFHTITLMSGYHVVFFDMEFRNKYYNEIHICFEFMCMDKVEII